MSIYENADTNIKHIFKLTTDQFPTLRSFDFADVGQSKSYLEIICFTSEDGLFHKEYFTVDEFVYKPTDQMKIITESASGM